jgi:mRNA interferase MazF
LDRLRVADRFRTSLPQIFTVDKALLTEKIGRLDLQRVRQILAGLALITAPAVIDEYP